MHFLHSGIYPASHCAPAASRYLKSNATGCAGVHTVPGAEFRKPLLLPGFPILAAALTSSRVPPHFYNGPLGQWSVVHLLLPDATVTKSGGASSSLASPFFFLG